MPAVPNELICAPFYLTHLNIFTLSNMFPELTEGSVLSPDFSDLAKGCIFGSISGTSAQERSEERKQHAESSGMPREDPSTPRRWTSRPEGRLGMEGMVGS